MSFCQRFTLRIIPGVLLGVLLTLLPTLLSPMTTRAQDGVNLPTALYLLRGEGLVERVGLGNAGITTVTPPDEFVIDFRVAPDGNLLAYRTRVGVLIADMYSDAEPVLLEGERASVPLIRGSGETIAWAPDGGAIAYTTLYGGRVWQAGGTFTDLTTPNLRHLMWSPGGTYLAAESDIGAWWLFRRDAAGMVLIAAVPESAGATWVSDALLAFAPPEGGLRLMDLSQGNTQSELVAGPIRYFLPLMTVEGVLAYEGSDPEGQPVGQLRQVTLDGTISDLGEMDVDVSGLRWAPRGEWLVAARGGVLALVNPLTGEGFTLPFNGISTYSWGVPLPPPVERLPLQQPVFFIARDNTGIAQVWRLRPDALAETITPAITDVLSYSVSPAGDRLAYVSNGGLWLTELNGADTLAEPVEVVRLTLETDITPVFSTDGAQLYYRDRQDNTTAIWRLDIAEGTSTPFVADADGQTYTHPQMASGINALLVTRTGDDGDTALVLIDAVSGEQRTVGPYDKGWWLNGARFAFTGQLGDAMVPALMRLDATNLTDSPVVLTSILENWEVLDVAQSPAGDTRLLIRQQRPGMVTVLQLPPGGGLNAEGNVGYITQPNISPDGTALLGLTHPGGILIYQPINGERLRLRGVQGVRAVQWPGEAAR